LTGASAKLKPGHV